jgi:hypothetical protein
MSSLYRLSDAERTAAIGSLIALCVFYALLMLYCLFDCIRNALVDYCDRQDMRANHIRHFNRRRSSYSESDENTMFLHERALRRTRSDVRPLAVTNL